MDKIPMTRDGYLKIENDLSELRSVDMKECLQSLSDARDKGDLSENAEYETAKQAIEDLHAKMSKLSNLLQNAQLIDTVLDDGSVQLLTYVKFRNVKLNKEIEYRIVPEYEIDLKAGKISPLSPIGKALMNKRVGDTVFVDIPSGKLELEILNIRIK